MTKAKKKSAGFLLAATGSLFGLWALVALVGGLHKAQWNVVEFARQSLVASGMIQPIHTVVDFYTHIKGIEYIICVMFFVAFPLFFRFVDKREREIRLAAKSEIKPRGFES